MSLSGSREHHNRARHRFNDWVGGSFVCAGYELFAEGGDNYTGRKKEKCKCTTHIQFVLTACADWNKKSG